MSMMNRQCINYKASNMVTKGMVVDRSLSMNIFKRNDAKKNPLLKTKIEILERFNTYRLILGVLGRAINKNIAREIIVRADLNPNLPINQLMNLSNKFNFPEELMECLFKCMVGASEELIKGAFK